MHVLCPSKALKMTVLLLLDKTQVTLSQQGSISCRVHFCDYFWDSALIPPSTQTLSTSVSRHVLAAKERGHAHQRGRGRLGQALAEVVVHEHVGGWGDGEQLQRRVGAL